MEEGEELCFPELSNASCRRPMTRLADTVLLQILLYPISALTIALNLLVIISVSHFRQLHTPTNVLLLSLAVSDFIVGLLVWPGSILLRTGCWSLGDHGCSIFNWIAVFVTSATVGDMVLISVDRYIAICDPLHYSSRITVRKVQINVCLCWICAVIYGFAIIHDSVAKPDIYNSCVGQCVLVIEYVAVIVDLVLIFIAPVAIIVTLYMRVFIVALSQARAMRSHVTSLKLQNGLVSVHRKSELKAARTLGVVIVVFLICLCPFYCVAIAGDSSAAAMSYAVYMFNFNSCLNPLIYALFYPWFRKTIKVIMTLQILQSGSREISIL